MSKEYQMIQQLEDKTEEIHIQERLNGMSWNEKSSQGTRAREKRRIPKALQQKFPGF